MCKAPAMASESVRRRALSPVIALVGAMAAVRIFFLGSTLALLPVLAAEPSTRLLGVAMVGICGLIGLAVDGAWRSMPDRASRRQSMIGTLIALGLAYAHFVRAPLYSHSFTSEATRVELETAGASTG